MKSNPKRPPKAVGPKFYEFTQNNSGGRFVVDKKLCHRLFIEADNNKEADEIAEGMGVYFDGCNEGLDCSCCGDRWYPAWKDDGKTFPYRYGTSLSFPTVESFAQYSADEYGWTEPDARIFYKSGRVVEIFAKGREIQKPKVKVRSTKKQK